MGTRLGIHLEGEDRGQLQEASARVLAEVDRIEAACSTWRPESPWSRLNGARGAVVALDSEWLDLLGVCQTWSLRTRGAFDPCLKALMDAWGVREGGRTPGEGDLARALEATGTAWLELDRTAGTARLGHPRAGLEEGGFVKGYALDAARKAAGVPSGWLDFGGQLLSWGGVREVAVALPGDRQTAGLTVTLPASASLSCSGCSERGRHLLDPRTGRPCADWGLVAAVAGSGLEAEFLSTALYVHGPEAGLAWARERGAAAAFLCPDGTVLTTPAFQALVAAGCGAGA